MTEQQQAAMRQALEALDYESEYACDDSIWREERTALRQALEPSEMPKIGCVNHDCEKCRALEQQPAEGPYGYFKYDFRLDAWVQSRHSDEGVPFYTRPQPAAQWVGLTDEDYPEVRDGDHAFLSGALWAEVKLREKNGGKA